MRAICSKSFFSFFSLICFQSLVYGMACRDFVAFARLDTAPPPPQFTIASTDSSISVHSQKQTIHTPHLSQFNYFIRCVWLPSEHTPQQIEIHTFCLCSSTDDDAAAADEDDDDRVDCRIHMCVENE